MDTHIEQEPTEAEVEAAIATLKLLADPTRLRVVWLLLHGEHSVGALAEHLGVPPSGLSQHLAKLRLANLVKTRRDGNRIYYLVDSDHVGRLAEEALFHADHVAGGAAHHRADQPARRRA
ncbi:MAG: metalloregulator ArsR/SmtB family transcription factor [Actinomycetota bacterium]